MKTLGNQDLQKSPFSHGIAEAVDTAYQKFKKEHPEFVFLEEPSQHSNSVLSLQVAGEMARHTKVYLPVKDYSQRKYFAGIIVLIKSMVRKTAAPFMKLLMARQERMNDLSVSLAFEVASLEVRMQNLEERLKGS